MTKARPNVTSQYNKSGLNSTIKQKLFSDWVAKYIRSIQYSHETHPKYKDKERIEIKLRTKKKIWKMQKLGVAMPDKIEIKKETFLLLFIEFLNFKLK